MGRSIVVGVPEVLFETEISNSRKNLSCPEHDIAVNCGDTEKGACD